MTSVLETLGAERLRDSIARQGERLAGQARTGPAPGQVFGLSPNFLIKVPALARSGAGKVVLVASRMAGVWVALARSDLGHHRPPRRKTRLRGWSRSRHKGPLCPKHPTRPRQTQKKTEVPQTSVPLKLSLVLFTEWLNAILVSHVFFVASWCHHTTEWCLGT